MVRYNLNNIKEKHDRIMAANRKVHCRIEGAFNIGNKSYLLCGLEHQGLLQGFSPERFMRLDAGKQCRKCLQRLKERQSNEESEVC